MHRLALLFALLSLSFGLHSRLAAVTAQAHAHDIALAVLLMISSILIIAVAARLFVHNIDRIARKRGFVGMTPYANSPSWLHGYIFNTCRLYNVIFLVTSTLVLVVTVVLVLDG